MINGNNGKLELEWWSNGKFFKKKIIAVFQTEVLSFPRSLYIYIYIYLCTLIIHIIYIYIYSIPKTETSESSLFQSGCTCSIYIFSVSVCPKLIDNPREVSISGRMWVLLLDLPVKIPKKTMGKLPKLIGKWPTIHLNHNFQ